MGQAYIPQPVSVVKSIVSVLGFFVAIVLGAAGACGILAATTEFVVLGVIALSLSMLMGWSLWKYNQRRR